METRWEQAASRSKPKKYYKVTEKGIEAMTEAYSQWKAIARDITNIMEGTP